MKSPKKILLFTDTPLRGGAELQMFLLAKFLDKSFYTPVVCLGPYEALNSLADKFKSEGIQVIRLEIKGKNDPKQLKILRNIIKEEKIDLVHANLWNPASGRFAFLAAKSTKTPLIITEHDPFKIGILKNIFKKRLLSYASTIITVSKDNKNLLSRLYKKQKSKIKVIPNGIDLDWWKSQFFAFKESDRLKIRKEIFGVTEPKTLVALTVAELHERKGIQVLIEAVKEIKKEIGSSKKSTSPDIKFIIAGDGPHRAKFEKMISKFGLENDIKLLGRQKNIPRLMKSADFFILPSIREAFGLVILEAMVSNLPIIASKTGGIQEIIEDGKTGLFTVPGDEKSLATVIKKLANSSRLRTNLSKKASAIVAETFDAKKMAREYEKIYAKLSQTP